MSIQPAVELRGLTKRFGALVANEDIWLSAAQGSILAIVGENGAGKSTAMKMLYGLYAPDSGEIRVNGVAWGGRGRGWKSPSDAIACGIGMVHQHFMLAGPYTALENAVLGAESSVGAWKGLPRAVRPIDFKSARARLTRLSEQYGMPVDWDAPVESLPVGVQQRLEILKLLYRDARVLILDEPTAVLTPQEVSELFRNLRELAAQGRTVLIITHKLNEVMRLADRATVFRAGRVVGDVEISSTNPSELADLMVGRKVSLRVEAPPAPAPGPRVLETRGLTLAPEWRPRADQGAVLDDVSIAIRAGEIVGIAGIEGNGQSELLRALVEPRSYGDRLRGAIRVLGQETLGARGGWDTSRIKALGVGIVPEDRHLQGLLLERSVRENFLLGLHRRAPFNRGGFVSGRALDQAVGRAVEAYDVRPRAPDAIAGRLSGGNQQKLVIARELERDPRVLIAAQPTRGVDVGAIEFIHQRLFAARDRGAGVLLVSSELEEILTLSDRILVMYSGRIVASFDRGGADECTLGLCMGGAAPEKAGGRP